MEYEKDLVSCSINKLIIRMLGETKLLEKASSEQEKFVNALLNAKNLITIDAGGGYWNGAHLDFKGKTVSETFATDEYLNAESLIVYATGKDDYYLKMSEEEKKERFEEGEFEKVIIPTNEKTNKKTNDVRVNHKACHSMIAIASTGTYIGHKAIRIGKQGVIQNFKCLPEEYDLLLKDGHTKGEIFELFMQRFIYNILLYNDDIVKAEGKLDPSTVLVVTHPASFEWKLMRSRMRKAISAATGLPKSQIILMSEAMATIQYIRFRRSKDGILLNGVSDGIMIIDIGATTIDVAVSSKAHPKSYEASIRIGGHMIDEALLKRAAKNVGITPSELGELYGSAIAQIRDIKEDACTNHGLAVKAGRRAYYIDPEKEATNVTAGKDGVRKLKVGDWELPVYNVDCEYAIRSQVVHAIHCGQIPQEMTIEKHIKLFIHEIYQELKEQERLGDVNQVVITGGTANVAELVAWIEEGIKTEFGEQINFTILNSPEDYHCSVSEGAAYYTRAVLALSHGLSTLQQEAKKIINEIFQQNVDKMAEKLADDFWKYAVIPHMQSVANKDTDVSLKEIEQDFIRKEKEYFEAVFSNSELPKMDIKSLSDTIDVFFQKYWRMDKDEERKEKISNKVNSSVQEQFNEKLKTFYEIAQEQMTFKKLTGWIMSFGLDVKRWGQSVWKTVTNFKFTHREAAEDMKLSKRQRENIYNTLKSGGRTHERNEISKEIRQKLLQSFEESSLDLQIVEGVFGDLYEEILSLVLFEKE